MNTNWTESSRIVDVGELRFDEHAYLSPAPIESADLEDRFQSQLRLATAMSMMDADEDPDYQRAVELSKRYR
jgi:hypothetical protein